jgi:hypothetical protein
MSGGGNAWQPVQAWRTALSSSAAAARPLAAAALRPLGADGAGAGETAGGCATGMAAAIAAATAATAARSPPIRGFKGGNVPES